MRPKLAIDGEVVQRLASMQCTNTEIAAVLGCSRSLIEKRFRKELDVGAEQGRAKLRRVQWRKAMKGDTTMLIWLGKNMLGQSDKAEVTQKNTIIEVVDEQRTLNRDSDS